MKNKIFNGISILFGALLINSGLNKFLNYIPVPDDLPRALVQDNSAILEIVWLMPLIGFAEIVGGFLVLFPKSRALGVLVVFPVMVGMLLTHIFVAPSGLPMAVVIWATVAWIIFEYRSKYLSLLR